MATVVEFEISAERMGCARAFDRAPTLSFQIAGLIGDAPPLVWVSGDDLASVRAALETDPTVEILAYLTGASDGRWLFRLEFDSRVDRFDRIVSANDGAILEATGRAGNWSLELLFDDRAALSAAHEQLREEDFQVEVSRVSTLDDPTEGHAALTTTQYETIVTAHERGYFEVPRRVTLEELAAELGVSHQALSERLRRSHAALVSAELADRMAPTGIEP